MTTVDYQRLRPTQERQSLMNQFQILFISIAGLMRAKLQPALSDERGDGGGSALTSVLLAVGGVLAVGLVVAGIAAAVTGKLGDL